MTTTQMHSFACSSTGIKANVMELQLYLPLTTVDKITLPGSGQQ